jgi:hypothetical protein
LSASLSCSMGSSLSISIFGSCMICLRRVLAGFYLTSVVCITISYHNYTRRHESASTSPFLVFVIANAIPKDAGVKPVMRGR